MDPYYKPEDFACIELRREDNGLLLHYVSFGGAIERQTGSRVRRGSKTPSQVSNPHRFTSTP